MEMYRADENKLSKMNKIIINQKYKHLRTFIQNIPETFDSAGEIIYRGRNTIRKVNYNDLTLNIKSYKKPIFINRIVYSFFRKSKSKRAYEYALRLLDTGFATPEPVAYIECFDSHLLNKSYFVSIHSQNVSVFRDYQCQQLTKEISDMLQQLAEYVAALHENNIIHLDFSAGNILIEKTDEKYRFSLVDINRMKFKKIGLAEGMLNLGRLCIPDDKVKIIAKYYAKARNIDENICTQKMLKNNKKNIKKFTTGKKRKRKLLTFFGKRKKY